MRFLKAIVKLGLLGALAAGVVTAVAAQRRTADPLVGTDDEWSDVPTNPAA